MTNAKPQPHKNINRRQLEWQGGFFKDVGLIFVLKQWLQYTRRCMAISNIYNKQEKSLRSKRDVTVAISNPKQKAEDSSPLSQTV